MSHKNLKLVLLNSLNDELCKYGFVLRKTNNEFFQKCEVGENRFEIRFNTKYLLTATCATSIRCSVIQDLSCDILQAPAYIRRYHTFHSMMEDHPDFRMNNSFKLEAEENIPEIQQVFLKYFREVSLSIYKKYNTLEKIYELYTNYTSEQEELIRQSPDWYCDTIILARVLGKKDYPDLVLRYREIVKHYHQGLYLPTYEKVVIALENHPTPLISTRAN